MKKSKKLKIKAARDGDRVLYAVAWLFIAIVAIRVIPDLDTASNIFYGFARLMTAAATIFVLVALFTNVRSTQVAKCAWICAVAAAIFWKIPASLFNNFEAGWSFNYNGVGSILWVVVLTSILFWMFINFLKKRNW